MKPLPARDRVALQRAILALYSHRDLEAFRKAAPGIFMSLLHADQFALVDVRMYNRTGTARVLDTWVSRPGVASMSNDMMERHLYDHPFAKHAREHGPVRGALMLSDFLTLAQLRRTRLYRETLGPAKIGRVMSMGSFGGPGVATLTVTRPETWPNFSERDRSVFEMLCPHFGQARINVERETLQRASRSRSLGALGLTPREIEVALWLAQGKSNPEIAAILAAPVRTIEKHVERILDKMVVENRSAAAVAVAGIIRG